MYGILLYRSVYKPPIKVLQPLSSIDNVIAKISPPLSNVAVISLEDHDLPVVHVQEHDLENFRVRYFGSKAKILALMKAVDVRNTAESPSIIEDTYVFNE